MRWTSDDLKRWRLARGWSQRQVADAIKRLDPDLQTDARSVWRWENGRGISERVQQHLDAIAKGGA